MTVSILIVLPSCSQKNPIALVLLKDTSESAQNNEEFKTTTKKACKGITESISRGDELKVIQVNGEPDFFEHLTPTNPTDAKKKCGAVSTTQKQGTLTCPAVRTAHKIFQSSKKPGVLLVLIETNERESPCPQDWRTTVKNVIEKGGSVLILNATNNGGESFRLEIETALEGLPVTYAHTDVEFAIKNAIQETRRKAEAKP
ncbi:MAG: VWA domain-containing protein [Microcystis sp. M54BS1]|nr:VWA domain-containing protein [Microcystis sp. M62BS1]MCA2513466.1 VWA domain-containing protein [Microcystis sp. M60BS1]MCA2513719.1 VWA domain-containing protein [Microcystis sp. M59BS1]MCA2518617.1 VWA domain-containing protein [Microcystis sp. M63BS1]MCA2523822.1 VWA domain-containing protein [Microcystis sp. M61BS1]MCA2531887.1 VWA domain-containing protein [Microcystis sp. M51BS1]MCA2533060.1 VWA domain-containing protein [Microcystis sp. M57BS1]MCA2539451.1 VWA domain-containing pr